MSSRAFLCTSVPSQGLLVGSALSFFDAAKKPLDSSARQA